MEHGLERDAQNIRGDWEKVGEYFSAAMEEIAIDVGGVDFASDVAALAESEEVLPNPEALQMLESKYPGSGQMVMQRMGELQNEAHQRERAELYRPRSSRIGKAIINAFRGA